MKASITFDIDTDSLQNFDDFYLASLWHIGQANPAPISDPAAGRLAELIGREIIRRWLQETGVPLWDHQGSHTCGLTPDLIAGGMAIERKDCKDVDKINPR